MAFPPARHRFRVDGCSVSSSRVADPSAYVYRLVLPRGARPGSRAVPSPKSAVAAKPAACSSHGLTTMLACPRPPRRTWPTTSSSLRSSSPSRRSACVCEYRRRLEQRQNKWRDLSSWPSETHLPTSGLCRIVDSFIEVLERGLEKPGQEVVRPDLVLWAKSGNS